MKFHQLLQRRRTLTVVLAVVFAAGPLAIRAKADSWDRRTILTVNEPIQVRDTVLDPGQYVFKLYDSQSDRHVVQIFNADQSRIIATVIAIPKERMEPTGQSKFTFWETPTGTVPAMRAWFYPGDTIGQEFPHPKYLRELAVLTPPATTPPAPVVTQTPAPETNESTAEQTGTEANNEQQPAEVAQNSEPPAQAPPATPEPAPAPAPQPQELPKTGSPYPLIGLSGLALLGGSVLLRLKRAS